MPAENYYTSILRKRQSADFGFVERYLCRTLATRLLSVVLLRATERTVYEAKISLMRLSKSRCAISIAGYGTYTIVDTARRKKVFAHSVTAALMVKKLTRCEEYIRGSSPVYAGLGPGQI